MTRDEAFALALAKYRICASSDAVSGMLASLAASGFAVVPVRPTTEMLDAGNRAFRAARSSGVGGQTVENSIRMECYREAACWRAMIAAATGETNE